MSNSCLGGVIRTVHQSSQYFRVESSPCDDLRLRLGNVHNGTAHTANEDNATRRLALHEVLGDGGGEEISAVNIDIPQLAHALYGVVDGLKVLSEAGRGDQVINLSMLLDDVLYAGIDRRRVRDVGVMRCHLGDTSRSGVLLAEDIYQFLGLFLGFFLCLDRFS